VITSLSSKKLGQKKNLEAKWENVRLNLIATSIRRLATIQKKTVAHLIWFNAIISYPAKIRD